MSSYSFGQNNTICFCDKSDIYWGFKLWHEAILIEGNNKAATTISQNEIGLKYDKQRDLKYFGLIKGQILEVVSNIGEVIIV